MRHKENKFLGLSGCWWYLKWVRVFMVGLLLVLYMQRPWLRLSVQPAYWPTAVLQTARKQKGGMKEGLCWLLWVKDEWRIDICQLWSSYQPGFQHSGDLLVWADRGEGSEEDLKDVCFLNCLVMNLKDLTGETQLYLDFQILLSQFVCGKWWSTAHRAIKFSCTCRSGWWGCVQSLCSPSELSKHDTHLLVTGHYHCCIWEPIGKTEHGEMCSEPICMLAMKGSIYVQTDA